MKALVSGFARKAAIRKHEGYLLKSAGGEWNWIECDDPNVLFDRADDIQEIEVDDFSSLDRLLLLKSNAARALTLLDVAFTAPDDGNAAWAAKEFTRNYSGYVKDEVDKFAFAMEMPSDLPVRRIGHLRSQNATISIFLNDLENAQPRIKLLWIALERVAGRLRLEPQRRDLLGKQLVDAGLFSEFALFNRDANYLIDRMRMLQPKALHPEIGLELYNRAAGYLLRTTLRDRMRIEADFPVNRLALRMSLDLTPLTELIKALLSIFTLRK